MGNPSALAVTALLASLEIFLSTSMSAIRTKSISLTKYLEDQLLQPQQQQQTSPTTGTSTGDTSGANPRQPPSYYYTIITPLNPSERGAQLSIRLKPGLLVGVLKALKDKGIVVDARKPDVIRVAPAPLYNTYSEVWEFARIFRDVCWRVDMDINQQEERNKTEEKRRKTSSSTNPPRQEELEQLEQTLHSS